MIFSRHHKYLTQNLVGFCWNKNVSEYLAELKGVYRESQWCSGTDGRGWLVPSRAGSRQALAMPCDCRVGAAFTHSLCKAVWRSLPAPSCAPHPGLYDTLAEAGGRVNTLCFWIILCHIMFQFVIQIVSSVFILYCIQTDLYLFAVYYRPINLSAYNDNKLRSG